MKGSALIAVIVGATALAVGHAAPAEAAQATGCLTAAGQIRDVAFGDAPSRPCAPGEGQITFQLAPTEPDASGEIFPFFILLNGDAE